MDLHASGFARSLDELSHGFPRTDNAFLLDDLVWEHFSLPEPVGNVESDRAHNPHIDRCAEALGGLQGTRVLDLGAYEGYDSRRLEAHGVNEILSIEGNPRNFLKCLSVKNHYRLDRTQFLLGNCETYLAEAVGERFDMVLASGVLYHLFDPIAALENIIAMTDNIAICTTYWHPELQGFAFTGETRVVELDGVEPITLYERTNTQLTKGMKHGMTTHVWMYSFDGLLTYLRGRNFDVDVHWKTENPEPYFVRTQLLATRSNT